MKGFETFFGLFSITSLNLTMTSTIVVFWVKINWFSLLYQFIYCFTCINQFYFLKVSESICRNHFLKSTIFFRIKNKPYLFSFLNRPWLWQWLLLCQFLPFLRSLENHVGKTQTGIKNRNGLPIFKPGPGVRLLKWKTK